MKKAGKIISYLLVLTLVTGLFTGIGALKADSTEVKAETRSFNVLEIVPDKSMATFGYLVAGQEPAIGGNSVLKNCTGNTTTMAKFLSENGYGEITYDETVTPAKVTGYKSKNYFVEKVLKRAVGSSDDTWNVTVTTKTPEELNSDSSAIDSADFIVINQTVPTNLRITGVSYAQTFKTHDFNWSTAYKIFEKIAGVKSNPIPYMVDYQIFSDIKGSDLWVDVRTPDNAMPNDGTFVYIKADQIDQLEESSTAGCVELGKDGSKTGVNGGTNLNVYKLFKLIASINPSTMYGLYFKENDGSYGINPKNGKIISVGLDGSKTGKTYNLGVEYDYWADAFMQPLYLSCSKKSISKVMKAMSWIDHAAKNSSTEFYDLIGGKTGAGILYNSSSKSLFYVMKSSITNIVDPEDDPLDDLDETVTSHSGSFTVTIKDDTESPYTITSTDEMTEMVKKYALTTENNAIANDKFKKYCKKFGIEINYFESISYSINADISLGEKSYTVSDDASYRLLLTDLGLPADTVAAATFPVTTNKDDSGWLKNTEINNKYGWEYAGKITDCSCSVTLDGSNNITSCTYTVKANAIQNKDYMITDLEGFKAFLTELTVPSDKIDATEELPMWKDNFKNQINNVYGNSYYNMIKSCSYTYLNGWYFADGTEAEVDTTDLDSEKAFIRENLVCSSEDFNDDMDAESFKEILFDKFKVSSDQTAWQVVDNNAAVLPSSSGEPTPSGGTGDGADKLALMVKSFKTKTRADYHPYRFLIVTDNSVDKELNRSLIADMVEKANSVDKGLVGGILIDCVSQYYFENISVNLNDTYDAIYKKTTLGAEGSKKWSSYTAGTKLDNSGKNSLINAFTNKLKNSFGVQFLTTPTEYYSGFTPDYSDQNGFGGYLGSGDVGVAGKVNYINPDSNKSKRTMDFKFEVKGSGTYNIALYIDKNHNDLFDSDEAKFTDSCTAGTVYEKQIPLSPQYFDKDYVGGFAWKLVVSSGSHSVTKSGYSALQKTTDKKQTIRVLQIYPTDYKKSYGATESGNVNYFSNPVLLLPTKDEIKQAAADRGRAVTAYDINDSAKNEWDGDGLYGLCNHFTGNLSVDVINYDTRSYDTDEELAALPSKVTVDGVEKDILTQENITRDSSGNRNRILYNAGWFSYFLYKLEDYDVDATRYSVYSFNKAVADGDIVYNDKTQRLSSTKAEGGASAEHVTNTDGSNRYVYSPSDLGLDGDSWKDEKVNWGGEEKNYWLVDTATKKIYGKRETYPTPTYFGESYNEIEGTAVMQGNNDFDLVMIGFGSNMDYMSTDAVNLLSGYLEKGPAFIGNGAVTLSPNNSLGKAIDTIIGMYDTSAGRTGETSFASNDKYATQMVTNDTLFSHYPYSVPHYLKNTSVPKQPYRLNLADNPEIVVSFAKYHTGGSNGYGNWGDGQENYYLYKKGNITFCGFGGTNGNDTFDQKGGVMTMAENLMVVNALVTSARSGSDGKVSDPFMNCVDIDRSVVKTSSLVEDDERIGSYEKWYLKDAVYTDYDSFGIARYGIDDASTLFSGSDTSALASTVITMDDSSVSLSVAAPNGFVDKTNNVRWVPYQAKLATANGKIKFLTTDNRPLNLEVYQYTASTKTFSKLTPTSNEYSIEKNGVYYVGIPLAKGNSIYENSGSTEKDKLGFSFDKSTPSNNNDQFTIKFTLEATENGLQKEVEVHTITMVRRVMYPVK